MLHEISKDLRTKFVNHCITRWNNAERSALIIHLYFWTVVWLLRFHHWRLYWTPLSFGGLMWTWYFQDQTEVGSAISLISIFCWCINLSFTLVWSVVIFFILVLLEARVHNIYMEPPIMYSCLKLLYAFQSWAASICYCTFSSLESHQCSGSN